MKNLKTKIKKATSILTLFSLLALGGTSCTKGGDIEAQRAFQTITLDYWTVFNSPDDYNQVIANYQALHPNIRINVQKFRFEEYEEKLLNALAEDRGPDIFSVHHTWLPEYRTKLFPLPSSTTLAVQQVQGTVKKEVVTSFRTTRSLNQTQLRQQFVEQVYEDVVIDELAIVDGEPVFGEPQIYGLPAAFDTMVLYYNRDLLDNAGISTPAVTWNEFQDHVSRLARFDSQKNILTAGAAIGTANNTPRAVDILSILMMQNGAVMEEDGLVQFHKFPPNLSGERNLPPGLQALEFYTSFGNQNRQNFTWDEDQIDGFEAFLQGKTAYFFGYSYHDPQIKALAPQVNLGVTTLPIIQGNTPIYFANYWAESVSRKTRNPDAAWDFIQYLTSAEGASAFLATTKKPTARRDLIPAQEEDPDLFVYASQALTSRSWYDGQDAAAMEGIMKDLITDTLAGVGDIDDLIELAAERVQQTYRVR